MPKKISSTDLLWVFREQLTSRNAQFKNIPIAIVPSDSGWEAVTSPRYRNSTAKQFKQISDELRPIYRLVN